MRNNAGALITGAPSTALAAKLDTAEVLGYTLTAYRANSNLRQRGQLLDSQIEYQVIQLPYRSPLAVVTPAINNGTEDNSALQTLITVTGIRVSNEAVSSLLRASASLKSYNPVADADGNLPEISAIGRFYVKPVYFEAAVDLATSVDSLKSHERLKDIRAALVERVRYYANEMYRESEYKAAGLVLTGNAGFKPTVIVGTDPVIYNYIMADGDLRTLGESFDVKVVSTLDSRVAGKIFVTFGVFDSSRNTSVNPLNFGNMLWSPELTVVLPVSRDGQTSKELIVAPRFAHIVNLPMMTVLTVSGLPSVVGKVAIDMNAV
ncbi:MAG: Major capsid protein [uncultured bacterium]|nr:MAG: Major capsid protein [uncultured bacterium]